MDIAIALDCLKEALNQYDQRKDDLIYQNRCVELLFVIFPAEKARILKLIVKANAKLLSTNFVDKCV